MMMSRDHAVSWAQTILGTYGSLVTSSEQSSPIPALQPAALQLSPGLHIPRWAAIARQAPLVLARMWHAQPGSGRHFTVKIRLTVLRSQIAAMGHGYPLFSAARSAATA
jgi:hypothetical protein